MSRLLPVFVVAALAGGGTVVAVADHPGTNFVQNGSASAGRNAGSGHPDAAFRDKVKWELVKTFPSGNPHTDLDFFTQGAGTYASVGTLAVGPNGGGQTIIKLAEGDTVNPSFVSQANTAQCTIGDPNAALGLQHDVEASPKGNVLMNTLNPSADKRDAQLIIDATDGRGRCHDQGTLALQNAPLGGLELIDITDITKPKEIGLTTHIGQAHTVNVDPKRPHIAFAVTSDGVNVSPDTKGTPDTADDGFTRANETSGSSLDGFEVVDMSSCMNFPAGTTVEDKRKRCRPQVYRYRYPTAEIAMGHTLRSGITACHETEIYPDDRLTCGSGAAAILFDLKGAFDDNGTPDNYLDDKPRGTPLPCVVRPSSSSPPITTTAMVTDCATTGTVVAGQQSKDLRVSGWLKDGAPSLEGVKYLGSIHHQGRGAGSTPPTSATAATEDLDFNHESEITPSGRFLLNTDERGGGVAPPGASCVPAPGDNIQGNGGIHAYPVSKLDPRPDTVPTREEAQKAYARTSKGEKAIFRVPVRTQPEGTFCTAHVMQIIPGQNRIFMGWYTQGTQVVDFTENADGTIDFVNSGYFIPENANTWTSHIFKVVDNKDGTFTYFGAAGDFNLGSAGRNAIDVYKVTMPAPPKPADPLPTTPTADTAVASLSMNISSREITAGNRPILSGIATNAKGEPVKNTRVQLSEKRYNTTTFRPLTTLTTDEFGRFRTPIAPLVQTAYGVTVGRVASRTQVVGVHTRMDITSPTAGSTVGSPTTVTGRLSPAFAGGAVGLAEKLPDGRFRYLAQSESDPSTGAYRVTAPFSSGRHVLVVYTSPRNGNLFGSKSVTVTVR